MGIRLWALELKTMVNEEDKIVHDSGLLSNEELIKLVLEHNEDEESYNKLLRYRDKSGQTACVQRMLTLFKKRLSAELCEKAWDITLNICLTDDDPTMDEEISMQWTEAIMMALQDQRPEIRITAADAFRYGVSKEDFHQQIIQALMQGLLDESEDVRFSCGQAIQHAGSAALTYLLRALADSRYQKPHYNRDDRCSSVWDILFTIDGILRCPEIGLEDRKNCVQSVGNFLKVRSVNDGIDPLDIWKAGDTIGEYIGGREALETLSGLIEHPDPRVRKSVVHGLSHVEEPEAKQRLQILLSDPIESVRIEAAKYLKNMT